MRKQTAKEWKAAAADRMHERYGWLDLVRLEDIYNFEAYLCGKGWHACVTRGNELMRVRRNMNEFVTVWYDEKHHATATDRHGMVLWCDFAIFGKARWF